MNKVFIFFIGVLIALAVAWVYFDHRDTIEEQQYQREISRIDSLKQIKQEKINQLEKDTAILGQKRRVFQDSIEVLINKIRENQQESDKKKQEIDSLPIDSVAKIIARFYGGDTYKILRLEKGIFVAFKDTLIRKIGRGTIELKKLKYETILLHSEIDLKDSVITNLSLENLKQDSIIDEQKVQLSLEEDKTGLQKTRIKNLEQEVRKFKIIGSGGIIIGILIAIL